MSHLNIRASRLMVALVLLSISYWAGVVTERKVALQATIPKSALLISEAVKQLFPDYEVVEQVLQADLNGDGHWETVAIVQDFFDGAFSLSMFLCVVKEKTGGKLSVVRKVTLQGKFAHFNYGVYHPPLDKGAVVMDVTGDGVPEVVVPAFGGSTTILYVVALRGKNYLPQILYHGASDGVDIVRPKHRGDPWQIVERWCIWHLDVLPEQFPPRFRGHVLARKIFEWNRKKGKFILTSTEPDVEAERALSRDELRHIPGADVLLKNGK